MLWVRTGAIQEVDCSDSASKVVHIRLQCGSLRNIFHEFRLSIARGEWVFFLLDIIYPRRQVALDQLLREDVHEEREQVSPLASQTKT